MFFCQDLLCLRPTSLSGKMKASEAQTENLMLFTEMFNRFSNIAVTRFDWENLPETVSERFLNQTLYCYGSACFFESDELGYLALPCTTAGEYNMYYEPTRVEAFSFNFNRMLERGQFVFIRDNPTCVPTAVSVFEYTRRMADVLRTIDVLCKKMKQPFIFTCDEKQRLTYENLIKKITDNEVIIIGAKEYGLNKDSIEVVELPVNQDLIKLWEVYHNLETLLFTALGIESTGYEKRERLLVDEVNSNNMVTQMSADVNLKELETGCQKINEMYGLNVQVKARGIKTMSEGVGQNGELYDNPEGPA